MVPEVLRFGKWLRRKNPQATTQVHYLNDLKLFFAWANKPPPAITLRDVDAYIEHAQEQGHAVATVNRRLAALRSFYHFLAVESDNAPVNPVLPKRHFIRQGRRLPRDVEDADVEKLFAVISSARDRAMFLLMLRCGLRISEVAELQLVDLYLDEPRLRIVAHGKGAKERSVYVSLQAEGALRDYLVERPAVACDFVFLSYLGDGMSTTAVHKRLMVYRRRAGVHLTAHQLRHSFANDLLTADVPVTSIQKLLGHRWLETTQVYVEANDRQVREDYYAASGRLEGWR
jgi:site-specific recombinase XerD